MKEHLIGAPHRKLLDLLTNNRLGWKALPGTNTLVYLRKIMNLATWSQCLIFVGKARSLHHEGALDRCSTQETSGFTHK